ncbi:MAG: pullulanase-type alpha-1,6-glucosidase [Candidatus Eisenbacteria bacterium]|nr:pullulanase-type alpha-1,6-glucosidase [Candidatus Eisenbacteria bacterium]
MTLPFRLLRIAATAVRPALFVLLAVLASAAPALAEPVVFTFVPVAGQSVLSVSVRGSMNTWGETAMTKGADGTWSVTIDLAPGEHQYKYFVNGEWPGNMKSGADGGPLDPAADNYVDDTFGGLNAVRRVAAGGAAAPALAAAPKPPATALEAGTARIHYFRPDGQYDDWKLHVWEDAQETVTWEKGLTPAGTDAAGAFWDVRLKPNAAKIGFIVHKGDEKDPGVDMFLVLAEQGPEAWLVSGRSTISTKQPDVASLGAGDLTRRKAHWVRRDLIAWPGRPAAGAAFQLHATPNGGLKPTPTGVIGGETIALTRDTAGLPREILIENPHLAGMTALRLDAAATARAPEFLRGELAVSVSGPDGKVQDATGVQIPGVLDDLFTYDGTLGVTWAGGAPTLRVWAPTARAVRLLMFADSKATTPAETRPMNPGDASAPGVWSLAGPADWANRFYLYEVEVFVPTTGLMETNRVTDPYSRGLARNSRLSQIVDLNAAALKPDGWDAIAKPALAAPEDITLYELHIRDFSALDESVPAAERGTFLAFTRDTPGTRHLKNLADAGLSHVHLLPVFDIATVNEDRSTWKQPADLSKLRGDSEEQQAEIAAIRGEDGYNWGYDPWHYGVPEGSYSTDPDGTARLVEFRRMVQALNAMGLRVVMDVVYNHTNASGQNERSVLDRIVPGYYHRLSLDGVVETSTCCQNTASEHHMMEKLIADDLVHWARDYKIDGFRFDLMGHHLKRNMETFRSRLAALTPAADGVDGSTIYLYGEGWDFGEVAKGARGPNATQPNMAGTGIGTFNDRIRDAIRGGNPFGDRREQGFTTGIADDPNGFSGSGAGDRGKILGGMDRIKVGLAGNMTDFAFINSSGQPATGGANGVGYARDPQEVINYAAAHDNETFWDKIAYAAPPTLPVAERVRMQMLSLALVGLGQGIPFFHAGEEMLRSKSMDADSYNSGDWFNRLDFTFATNNFGVGLPMADKNKDRWSIMKPLFGRSDLTPATADIQASSDYFREILAIRKSSPLFRLRTADDIRRKLSFPAGASVRIPGVIVMTLADPTGAGDTDPNVGTLLVIFNATKSDQTVADDTWRGGKYTLHPAQEASSDSRTRTSSYDAGRGAFKVPARTTAVFRAP